MRVVVTYDITDDDARARVARLLEALLTRVQFSVFEGDPPATLLSKIERALACIDPVTDSIRVYQLCRSCARRIDVYGKAVVVSPGPFQVL